MVKSKKLSRGSLAVLLLALMLAISMVVGITGAWFTDKEEEGASFTFGTIQVTISDNSDAGLTKARAVSTNDAVVTEAMPGDTIQYVVAVGNEGNHALFYLVHVEFADEGADDIGEDENGYYYWNGSTTAEAKGDAKGAGLIAASGSAQNVTVSFTIPDAETGNAYQGQSIAVTATVYAIQAANVADGAAAYDLLMGLIADQSGFPENVEVGD